MNDMKRYHIKVFGKVQGVFYRKSTQKRAEHYDITGYVKNRDDGSVEIEAQGAESKLEQLIEWCHKGPERANVNNVEVKEVEVLPESTSFDIHY